MKIKELLTDESKWTRGISARNSIGKPIAFDSPLATCWCLIGAYIKCYPGEVDLTNPNSVYQKLIKAVKTKTPFIGISVFNDHPQTTFADIRKLIEELDI